MKNFYAEKPEEPKEIYMHYHVLNYDHKPSNYSDILEGETFAFNHEED